ncbi:FAD-binding domain-containing protein [Gymnopus androsaceus JB14]|uniref:FAD-binding domain-containing protein n=1 Tax=Gymnopus androsaceus JB14 TaxID=1447944 RepID=A0A6A4H7Y8_9AGAR|nr:FAD-binding domain-containing protein [Gymnopus androsaceus JB14]
MWQVPLISSVQLFLQGLEILRSHSTCRTFPGDEAWPKEDVWNAFNVSVDGRLIKTIPVGSPCHDPHYNDEACKYVKNNWHQTEMHITHPSSIMDAVFLNKSCDPFTPRESPCYIGSYVQYAVNVSEPNHVVKTIDFARKHNIRFVVKNTGHDYMGRSTGAGAISVWMHHLKDQDWFDSYSSPGYNGPALKAQAGVQGAEVNAEATKHGHMIVAGECPSVGFAGGYIQGGGHSILSSVLGLAADHTLAFEVITTTGEFVTASPTENQDLYWALSGGGGGTYGIVWSVTVKAHPDIPMAKAQLVFNSDGISRDTYWKAITAYQKIIPSILDTGSFLNSYYSVKVFQMAPLIGPNVSAETLSSLLVPWLDTLDSLGINYTYSLTQHATYVDTVSGSDNVPIMGYQLGGRILPRSLFQTEKGFSNFMSTVRGTVDAGAGIWDMSIRPSLEAAGYPNNSVHPEWRSAQKMNNVLLWFNDDDPLEHIWDDQERITVVFEEPLKQLSAGGGAYANEANPFAPDWKNAFYGEYYDRLLSIKDKWDPDQLLYGAIAVGGDRWEEMEDGRLCGTTYLK